ncbi:hypothetical protein Tco_0454234 [Tanacetum coccineum]
MRNTSPYIDKIDIDDLYNNLRVYEDELKSLQMDGDDLEELDLRWQVAMLTVRVKKKGHFARECRSGRNQGEDLMVTMVGAIRQSTFFEGNLLSSSSSSSDSEVQKCSKQCLESFKTLQKNYDTEREKHNKAKLEIRGYEIALESLESRILGHEKNELAWGEKYEFQNYELKCREIKINNLNLELEKVVKERDELKDKIAKWEESTKNLDEILNSQMSARDKTGLGYSTQLNELSSNHETDSENSLSIFDVRSSDEENIPENDRFLKIGYKVVPLHNRGNCQTNAEKPKSASESVVSNPKINRDRVIIEDWNSDDEEEEYEVQTVRPETQTVQTRDDKSGQNSNKQGIGFRKVKACFVCKSTNHLIKDCNFHDKKSQEPKLKNVVHTGQREGKPVWDNTKRINHQNFSKYPHLSKTFVPSGVLTRTSLHRPSVSTARPVCTARPSVSIARLVCIDRPSVSTARPSVSTVRPVYATRPIYPRMDNGKLDTTFKTQDGFEALREITLIKCPKRQWIIPTLKKGQSKILLQDHAVVDSGCSSHMTGNKAYLSDYEDFNGGFVAFGSDPKGDELKFNLFSVSQMCDKKNSVLFTESECLILSPSFKLLDESQVVLRAPRKDDVYNLDLKNIVPSGDSEDVIAKEGQHQMPEDEQVLHDELEKMVTQELTAKAMDDVSRQAFKEEKRRIASQKKATQATSPFDSIDSHQLVLSNTPNVSATLEPSPSANAGESSFVYLGGKIPINASTLPNADLPIEPNMLDLEAASDTNPNDGIFNRAYDDDEDVGAVADFNNMG